MPTSPTKFEAFLKENENGLNNLTDHISHAISFLKEDNLLLLAYLLQNRKRRREKEEKEKNEKMMVKRKKKKKRPGWTIESQLYDAIRD